jgi:HPt (histidine-containing phosphotransfer) domain-containing protein
VAGPPDSDAPLDGHTLEELRELTGPRVVSESIELFYRSAEKNLLALRDAHRRGDLRALERGAHALRGSCAILGARGMTVLARTIEDVARGGGDGIAALLDDLDAEYARTRSALLAEQQRPPEPR